ncbi:MAG: DUF4124 domain-containing protein [Thiobacillaceae bacterium]
MKYVVICLTLAGTLAASPVKAEIYKYIDENGQVTFTDMPRKGVKANHIYNMPAGPTNLGAGSGRQLIKKNVSFRPADFPRIDPATQRKRDDIRRQVLREELTSERQNLAESQRQLSLGSRTMTGEKASDDSYVSRVKRLKDAVEQHQSNIAAIQKELDTSR